jgi:hypothetical protein
MNPLKRITSLFALSALVLLTACGGTQDLGRGKTGKSMLVQGGTYDQVWNAALAAVRETDGDQKLEIEKHLTVTKEDKAAGVINASAGKSLHSWGEVVGVFISPTTNAPQYTVEVESLAKIKVNITANNWEDELLAAIKKNLTTPQP